MKTQKKIEEILEQNTPFLYKKFNVNKIGIFGSYAKGLETPQSDIDILVGFYIPIGWEFVDLKEFLEKILNKEVDLVTVGALKPQLKDDILKEVIIYV